MTSLKYKSFERVFLIVAVALAIVLPLTFCSANASANKHSLLAVDAPTPAPPADKAVYSGYKGVAIGTAADECRQKLGTPKEKSDAQDFYVFSDAESVQVFYDAAHKVNALSITYTGNLKDAPTPKDVFGADVEAKPDGGVFKMVRYPKSGFWISYTRTGGDDPLIMLAIQKL